MWSSSSHRRVFERLVQVPLLQMAHGDPLGRRVVLGLEAFAHHVLPLVEHQALAEREPFQEAAVVELGRLLQAREVGILR